MSTKREKRVQALIGKYADSNGDIRGPSRRHQSLFAEYDGLIDRSLCSKRDCPTCKRMLKPGCTLKLLARQEKQRKHRERQAAAKLDKELKRSEWEYIIL